MLEDALQAGLDKLKKEQEAYEEAQRIISSDDLDDWLVALTSTKVLNALSSTSNRTALFEKTVGRIMGDVELKRIRPQYFDFERKWSYMVEGTEIIVVNARSKQAGLKLGGVFSLYSTLEKHADRLDAKTKALQDWKRILEESETHCKGLRNWKKRSALESAMTQWEAASRQHQSDLKDIEGYPEKPMTMQERMEAFAVIGEEVKKVLSLHKKAGFEIIYPKQEEEHYAIKTRKSVMRVAEPDAQRVLRSALGRDVEEPNWDGSSNSFYSSEFALTGSALRIQEISIYPDDTNNIGHLHYERQLDEFELQALHRLLYKCNAPLTGVNSSKEEIVFRHAILPLDYHIYSNGKIKIERLTGRDSDESHAFYALVGLRSLLDMPGFVEWVASLSGNHYTKLKD